MTAREVAIVQDITSGASAAACRLRWVRSSLSFANGDCVEVARLPDGRVAVRDSKDPAGPVLRFTPSEWAAFLAGVHNGEFTLMLAG
jgi:Domain of unknown function (DUF397)